MRPSNATSLFHRITAPFSSSSVIRNPVPRSAPEVAPMANRSRSRGSNRIRVPAQHGHDQSSHFLEDQPSAGEFEKCVGEDVIAHGGVKYRVDDLAKLPLAKLLDQMQAHEHAGDEIVAAGRKPRAASLQHGDALKQAAPENLIGAALNPADESPLNGGGEIPDSLGGNQKGQTVRRRCLRQQLSKPPGSKPRQSAV